jgi:hypothetical protein
VVELRAIFIRNQFAHPIVTRVDIDRGQSGRRFRLQLALRLHDPQRVVASKVGLRALGATQHGRRDCFLDVQQPIRIRPAAPGNQHRIAPQSEAADAHDAARDIQYSIGLGRRRGVGVLLHGLAYQGCLFLADVRMFISATQDASLAVFVQLGMAIEEFGLFAQGRLAQQVPNRPCALAQRNLANLSVVRRLDHRCPIASQKRKRGAHGLDGGNLPDFGGQQNTRRAADQVQAAGGDERFVEVVNVVAKVAVVGLVRAEILQVQVAADQDRGPHVAHANQRPARRKQVVDAAKKREHVFRHARIFDSQQFFLAVRIESQDLFHGRKRLRGCVHACEPLGAETLVARKNNEPLTRSQCPVFMSWNPRRKSPQRTAIPAPWARRTPGGWQLGKPSRILYSLSPG